MNLEFAKDQFLDISKQLLNRIGFGRPSEKPDQLIGIIYINGSKVIWSDPKVINQKQIFINAKS